MRWLLAKRHLARNGPFSLCSSCPVSSRRFISDTSAGPLRILFCGSDKFSATSLRRLEQESSKNPDLIASIDVVCKTGKPSGRGLRKIRDVPIKNVAEELGLPLHEIPTFTGWSPPVRDGRLLNLIIAVSFGLLVPERLLRGAEYGGLNLHPSLLPELRGPAPLQHTILNGLKESGISLQTLHPKKFDHGVILAQDHFTLPSDVAHKLGPLEQFMARRAADLLVASLRKGVHRSPNTPAKGLVERPESHAPKTTSEHAHVPWKTWSATNILQSQGALGPLWSSWTFTDKNAEKRSLRIVWHDMKVIDTATTPGDVGLPAIVSANHDSTTRKDSGHRIGGVWTCDGKFVSPDAVTIEGRKKGWPGDSARVVEYLWSLTKEGDINNVSADEPRESPSLK